MTIEAPDRKFISDLRLLCAGQDVDDVFLGAFALMLSSIHQRTDNKADALRMLDLVTAGMKAAMQEDYEHACEVCDGITFTRQ